MTEIECGSLAGFVGGLVLVLYGGILKYLHILDRTFVDFGKAFIMDKLYPGGEAFLVGLVAHIVMSMIAGIGLLHILRAASFRWAYLKGALWGAIVWVILSGAGSLFDLPMFVKIPPRSAIGGLMGSVIFGLMATFVLWRLGPRMNAKSNP